MTKTPATHTSPTLPETFICFDTEYTSWEGAQERHWSGPNEHREIVQIGAVMVRGADLTELDTFLRLVVPTVNPALSQYFTDLTGITQEALDTAGIPYAQTLDEFAHWSANFPLYCWGADLAVMAENAVLVHTPFPFALARQIDVRTVFQAGGVDTAGYYSSSIPKAFGETPPPTAHDAQNDARSIVQGLRALRTQRG